MSTDEKYLFHLKDLPKNKVIPFRIFSVTFKNHYKTTSPESIFLLLYKKDWINIHAYQPAIDSTLQKMQLGLNPTLDHFYWTISISGRKQIESLKAGELLKINKLYSQTKLDL